MDPNIGDPRGGGYVANEGVCTEAVGHHLVLHCNTSNILVVHWGGADSGIC